MDSQYVALILAIWQVIQIIVRITPTKKDDEIVSKVGKVVNLVFNKSAVKK